ncbi:MAG: AAA family ATPase [Stackebrandtia sp.]
MTTLDPAGNDPVDPAELAKLIVARHIGDVPELAAEANLHARLKQGGAWVLDVPDHTPAIWGSGDEVLWAAGEALMIAGGQGTGKTTLAHQLIRGRLGLDNSLLGFPIAPGNRRVLYLGMDRPRQAARAMRRIVTEDERAVLDEHLRIWPGPPPADIAKHPNTLVDLATEADADTIIVDSLKDAAIGLTDDETAASYNRARQEAIAAGIEVLELHHNRKASASGARPDSVSDVYGSTWLTSGTGSVLLLLADPGDAFVEARHVKQPAADVGPLRIVHDHVTGRSCLDDPVDLVELAERCDGITATDAACRLFESETPTRNDIAKARRKLDRLVETGQLRRTGGGRGRGNQAAYLPVVVASGWETRS